MTVLIQQSTANDPLLFFLTSTADHISPLTGLGSAVTVAISKNGAAFGAPAGAISEIGDGWYQVAGNATDTNTLGLIALHATGTGADPCDMRVAQVVAFNPRNANLGLSNVSANVTQVNGSATAAANVSDANLTIGRGTCAAGGTLTSIPTSAWSLGGSGVVVNQFNGRTIIFDSNTATAALQGQAVNIIGNSSGATPTFTLGAGTLTTAPSAGDTFSVM